MRKTAIFSAGLGTLALLAVALAAFGRESAGVTQWHGLCIPSSQITNLQGTVFGKAFSQVKGDRSTIPEVTVRFSSKRLARAIQGYIPDLQGKFGTNMGSIVVIRPLREAAIPHGPANLGVGAENLWHLRGVSKNSSVKKIPGTDLYRVTAPQDQEYEDFFELVSVNLHKVNKAQVPPLSTWYVADCGQDNELGYTCNRHLFTRHFYVEYNFAKPNVTKLSKLDTYFRGRLKAWRDACKSH